MDVPSQIDLTEGTAQSEYDSHESLGFRKRERSDWEPSGDSRSYLSPPSKVHHLDSDTQPFEGAPDENAHSAGSQMHNSSHYPHGMGDTSMYGYEDDFGNVEKSETSRILELAASQPAHLLRSNEARFKWVPPLGVPESEFISSTSEFKSSQQRYVQVLIWCLTRRWERVSFPERRKTAIVKKVLDKFKTKLAAGDFRPRIYTQPITPLKPRLPNPENENMKVVISDLVRFMDELRESIPNVTPVEPVKADSVNPVEIKSSVDVLKKGLTATMELTKERVVKCADVEKRASTEIKERLRRHEAELEEHVEHVLE